MYYLPGNVISATVGLVYINLQPEYELLSRLVSDNSGSLEKSELGAPSSQPTLRKQFLHGVRVLVRGYLRVKFNLSSINFRDISDFPKLAPITLVMGHPRGS